MMAAESRKVLELLVEGKITIHDAERLLDKLAHLENLGDFPGQNQVWAAMPDLPAGFFESLFRHK
jgi:hypothetical protein